MIKALFIIIVFCCCSFLLYVAVVFSIDLYNTPNINQFNFMINWWSENLDFIIGCSLCIVIIFVMLVRISKIEIKDMEKNMKKSKRLRDHIDGVGQ